MQKRFGRVVEALGVAEDPEYAEGKLTKLLRRAPEALREPAAAIIVEVAAGPLSQVLLGFS